MAIEPKSPRKRAIKKSSKKSLAPSADSAEKAVNEVTAVPISVEPTESVAPKGRKKAAIPVPIFQAPEVDKSAPKTRKATAKSAPIKDDASSSTKDSSDSESSASSAESDSESESRSARNRRRRRGGRGRRKPNGQDGASSQEDSEENDSKSNGI